MRKDYYEILEITRDVSPQKIKEAYRRLAFQYHPDRNGGNPDALNRMKEINEAYAVLSDGRKRQDYDLMSERYGSDGYEMFRERYSEGDIFRGSDINRIFEDISRAFGFRGFEDVFRESYGQNFRTFRFQSGGFSGSGFIYFGGSHMGNNSGGIPFSEMRIPGLMGKITNHILKRMLGNVQDGTKDKAKQKDIHDTITLDSRKAREGVKVEYINKKHDRKLLVTIPPGIRDGQKVRLKGMGVKGRDGTSAGDLYLEVQVRKPVLEKIRELISGAAK